MSEILVNKLTGTSTAGSILVTGEGGAATMQLQQGLAKVWVNFEADSSNAIRDSFSLSSITDSGTGKFTLNLSSAMSNDDYIMTGSALTSQTSAFDDAAIISRDTTQVGIITTTANPFYTYRFETSETLYDCNETMVLLHGDLA
jgi:hypothetical protein